MIFPLGDDNRDRRTAPVVNVVLIVINVAVFVFFQRLGNNEQFTMAFATVPREIVTGKDVITPDQIKLEPTVEGPQPVKIPGLAPTPIPVYLTLLTAMV